MPKALVIWRDGRTRVISVDDSLPMTTTIVERPPSTDGTYPAGRLREFRRADGCRRALIYEEPDEKT